MSWRDDFNTIDTNVWQIENTIPTKGIVGVVGGKLRLGVQNLNVADGAQRVGIRRINPVDLTGKQVEISMEYAVSYSYIFSFFGVFITSMPYPHPFQRGIAMGMLGTGYDDFSIECREIAGTGYRPAWKIPAKHPEKFRIRFGEQRVYFYEVLDGKEWFVHNSFVNLPLNSCYVAVLFEFKASRDGVGTDVYSDYIDVSIRKEEEVPPRTIGETVKPPELPMEVAVPLLSHMMNLMIGGLIISIAERVRK